MDISSETSVEKLQSLAYEQIKAINVAQANLQALEQRIAQLKSEPTLSESKK